MLKLSLLYPRVFIVMHICLGIIAKYSALFTSIYFILFFLYAIYDVIILRDKDVRAGFYALYIVGFEMIYRISGITFSYELGKYLSICILIAGLAVSQKKQNNYIFYLLLLLLLPSIFLSNDPDPIRIRTMILFNILGPLSLVVSGLYFYKRPILEEKLLDGLKFAFYPAISFIVLLSIKASIGSMNFSSLESNAAASGGFGGNQVSTIAGWFLLLGLVLFIRGKTISGYKLIDGVLLSYILIRGMLTFSRGGMFAATLALCAFVVVLVVNDESIRKKMIHLLPKIMVIILLLAISIWYANSITNNYLYYRYMGKSTSEVLTGRVEEHSDYLSGRTNIMQGDYMAFIEYPLLGVGYGMAVKWHLLAFGQEAPAHTEYSRLMSENGTLGLLYILIAFIVLPIIHFIRIRGAFNKGFFLALLLISCLTMFHAAMRLSLAGIVYGASYMILRTKNVKLTKYESKNPIHR